jgi:hypothetical protein
MIHPYELIGLPYRLGATPDNHGAADCLSIFRIVMAFQGVPTPEPKRDWYRRIRKGDTSVFQEQLSAWGNKIDSPTIKTVALCRSEFGLGLATFFEEGWIHFSGSAAIWSPIGVLAAEELYCSR